MSTAASAGTAVAHETAIAPDTVRRFSDLCREFISEVRRINRGPLMVGDIADGEGADFVFTLEVKPGEYEAAVQATSKIEADYYFHYGVNFFVDVRAM